MLLTALIVAQLVFDVALVLFLLAGAMRRKAQPGPAEVSPPVWYQEFLRLAQDLLAVTESVLDAQEVRRPDSPSRPAAPESRFEEAFALLRAGMEPEEVARRGRFLPAELRLIKNLVAAEAAAAEPPRG